MGLKRNLLKAEIEDLRVALRMTAAKNEKLDFQTREDNYKIEKYLNYIANLEARLDKKMVVITKLNKYLDDAFKSEKETKLTFERLQSENEYLKMTIKGTFSDLEPTDYRKFGKK
jgi:CII-binding regulator of phage lambda lysogenization HflD